MQQKTKTNKTAKMIQEIVKNAKYITSVTDFHGTWIDNGCQYCTDTHRMLMLYEPIDVEKVEQIEQNGKIVDRANKMFEQAEMECTETIELPSVTEIKEKIKELIGRKYKTNKALYRLNNDPTLAVVNAKYLVECMEAIGATELKYNPNKPKNGMLFMETELGKVVLLPVYDKEGMVGYWKIDYVV